MGGEESKELGEKYDTRIMEEEQKESLADDGGRIHGREMHCWSYG